MIKYRDDNRVKRLAVPVEHLLNCFIIQSTLPGDTMVKLNIPDIPSDTTIVGAYHDLPSMMYYVLLYHASWPIVSRNEIVPILSTETEYIQVRKGVDCGSDRSAYEHRLVIDPASGEEDSEDPKERSWRDRPSQF